MSIGKWAYSNFCFASLLCVAKEEFWISLNARYGLVLLSFNVRLVGLLEFIFNLHSLSLEVGNPCYGVTSLCDAGNDSPSGSH